MIEDEGESVTEPTDEDPAPEPEAPREKSPWKAFIFTGLFAGLFGAAAGGYGVYEGLKRFAPTPAQPAEVDFSSIEAKLDAFDARISDTENAISDVTIPEQDPVDLSGVEARLAELEAAPRPEIDPAALSALQDAQADGFEWPDQSAVETRLAALETSVEALSDTPDTNVPTDLMDRLSAVEAELEALRQTDNTNAVDEAQLAELNNRISVLENQPAPEPVIERVSILAFPKAQLIQAVEDNQKGGIVEKTLSRHIRVKGPNDPLTLIDGIETDISEGRLTDAAKKFERLPAPVRSAGQAWYESVKASL